MPVLLIYEISKTLRKWFILSFPSFQHLGPRYEVATRIARALTFTGVYLHLFGTLLMTINRFTSLMRYGRYNKVCLKLQWCQMIIRFHVLQPWPNHVLVSIFIVIIVASYAITLELFFIKIAYKESRNRWEVTLYERSIRVLFNFPFWIIFSNRYFGGWRKSTRHHHNAAKSCAESDLQDLLATQTQVLVNIVVSADRLGELLSSPKPPRFI